MPRPKGSRNVQGERLKETNKKLLINALRESLGILSPALKVAGFSRDTFTKYYNQDEEFRKQVDEIREEAIDYVESQLFTQIKNGGAAQTIFYLKTKGKSRGYIETTEQNMTIDAIKIKYIIPPEKDDKPILPFNNDNITLELPE